MTLAQRIVLAIIKLLLKPLLSWKVEGRENMPLDGSLIVVANHVHLADPILLQLSFPRWLGFMAKQELFRYPLVGFAIRWTQSFSIRRQGTIGDKRKAIKQARDMLRGGMVLGMFPEGKRNRNGKLLPGKSGVAVIASQTGTPLLPVGIIGTEKLKGIRWLWKRPRIIINIGHPFNPPSIETRLTRGQTRLLTGLIMNKIAALLPADNRGVYGD